MSRASWMRRAVILAVTVAFAAATAAVFFLRAGLAHGNWPIDWELYSSDNGVLFQFAGDVFSGRALDWSFSPQVYVFPEIPISLVGYLLSGGSVQIYYVLVAAIDNAILFATLLAVVRHLWPQVRLRDQLIRTAVAAAPLLLPGLLSGVELLDFQLAPTYYFGAYFVVFAAPLLFLTRSRAVVLLLGVAVALTIASNPLTAIFVVPAGGAVLLLRLLTPGRRALIAPAVTAVAIAVVAAIFRLFDFQGLAGTSPLTYIDPALFGQRVELIATDVAKNLEDPAAYALYAVAVLVVVGGGVLSVVAFVRAVRAHAAPGSDAATMLYYRLVPLGTLAAMSLLFIPSYLYLWPVLVAPLCFALLALPPKSISAVGWTALGVSAASVVGVLALGQPAAPSAYLTYRASDTRCLDSRLPAGVSVGYADYFDARRVELTSSRYLRLIQLDYTGTRTYTWLANKAYYEYGSGSFFFLGSNTGEPTLAPATIERLVGPADDSFTCPSGAVVLLYTDPAKLSAIAVQYSKP